MPKISMQPRLADLDHQKELAISLRRLFKSQLRKLRNLPTPEMSITEYYATYLTLTYRITIADMRESEKYLSRFGAVCGLEAITSEDEPTGVRVFAASLSAKHKTENNRSIYLHLRLYATPLEGDAPEAKCRKVLIGTDTHTYTSTTSKYKIVCDEE